MMKIYKNWLTESERGYSEAFEFVLADAIEKIESVFISLVLHNKHEQFYRERKISTSSDVDSVAIG